MFDRLVVSTSQRRKGRTARFFACTSAAYLMVAALAVAASVYFSTPKLADSSASTLLREVFFPMQGSEHPKRHTDGEIPQKRDQNHYQTLDQIIENLGSTKPPVIQSGPPRGPEIGMEGFADGGPGVPGIPNGPVREPGVGNAPVDPPKPPDPPRLQTKQVDTTKPVPVSSTVLQGKAINKVVPPYPELAKRIRMAGEVSVEVIISPEGRVESVRVVSGHPMFLTAAQDAARRWRFEPTILNGVAVRVTGVITFVFKLTE